MPVHVPPDLPEASPIIIAKVRRTSSSRVEIAKATLARHRLFLEMLLQAANSAVMGNHDG